MIGLYFEQIFTWVSKPATAPSCSQKTIKLGWQESLLTPFLKKKTFWDHLLCNIGHSDPHLCSRKLIRKFIRFLWNPLPLLQTPQNLIRTKRKKEKLHITLQSFLCDIPTNKAHYAPTQRRESSSLELCPTECWGSVGGLRSPHELCSRRLGQLLKNHPVFSRPGQRCSASYEGRRTNYQAANAKKKKWLKGWISISQSVNRLWISRGSYSVGMLVITRVLRTWKQKHKAELTSKNIFLKQTSS